LKTPFHFYSDSEKLIEFLKSKSNISLFIENIMTKYFNGELIEITRLEIDMKIREEKLKKLTAERKIKEWEALHLETFEKTPSSGAKKAMKEQANKEKFEREAEILKKHYEISEDDFTPTVLNILCYGCGEKLYCTKEELNTVIIKHSSHSHAEWMQNTNS